MDNIKIGVVAIGFIVIGIFAITLPWLLILIPLSILAAKELLDNN